MLLRLTDTQVRRPTRTPDANAVGSVVPLKAAAAAPWPARPHPSVLSKSIPLFFISRDNDGFWIACEADLRIGGIFLSQRSAMRFAQRQSAPTPCATMILPEPHDLAIENRGNHFTAKLRPVMRAIKSFVSKIRSLAAHMSRAYIEDRMLRAAMEVDLYRGLYKHSNKNDDDLPIVRRAERPRLAPTASDQTIVARIKRARPTIVAFVIFGIVVAGIIALRVAVWLPNLRH